MAWGTDTYRTAVSNKEKGFETCRVQKIFSVIHYLEKQPEQMAQLMQSNHPLEILTLLSSYE